MIFIFENKGILIPIYLVVSIIATATGGRAIYEVLIGPEVPDSFIFIGMGVASLITALWTYLTKNDYYTDRNGVKQSMEIRHSFFFIKNDYWVYIFFALGIIALIKSLF